MVLLHNSSNESFYLKQKTMKNLSLLSVFSLGSAESRTTTFKNKSGNAIGYSKSSDNKTTFYDKSHNKICSSKQTNSGTSFFDKSGNKVGTVKTK